jgi:hypothetical protein
MYKLVAPVFPNQPIGYVMRVLDHTCIPFDPANNDYQNFKTQINDETAQLEDVDGNVMSPEAAKAYVATLP